MTMRFLKAMALITMILTPIPMVADVGSYSAGTHEKEAYGTQTPQASVRARVKGVVKDSEGYPLVGVFVYVKGTKVGVYSDTDGNYSVEIPASLGKGTVELTYQYMGTVAQDWPVTATDGRVLTHDVVLKEDNILEGAVVSVGYGLVQDREDLVGSAFQVTKEQIEFRPADRIDNLLAGLVPGMNVIESTTNGRPNVKIRIRGDGSLSASNEPLWIIDGVPVYTGTKTNSVTGTSSTVSPLSYMNPDDIESITVLKDASTTALYGADGSNGVILVTTRGAKDGKTTFNASVRYGMSNVDRSTMRKYLRSAAYLDVAMEAWTNSGRPASAFPYLDNESQTFTGVDTDWYDVYVGTGNTLQVNFSAAGGTETLKHSLSASYFTSTSPYIGNNQDRYSLRAKTDVKLADRLTAMVNLSGSYNYSDIFSLYSFYDEILPIFTPYNEDGSYRMYNYYSVGDSEYQLAERKFYGNTLPERKYNDHYQKNLAADASLTLEYAPLDGLKLTSQTSASFVNIYEAEYRAMKTLSGINTDDISKSGYSSRNAVFNYVFYENLRANFMRIFARKHKVTAMAGWEWKTSRHPYLGANGNGFVNDNIKEIIYAATDTRRGSSNVSQNKSLSYNASLSYSYDKRYTLALNWRREGNSAFSEYSRWDNFFSVGGLWNIHNEHFFNSTWIDQLSLKATFGNNGNSRIDTSSSYGSYNIGSGDYYGTAPGATQGSPANSGLHWEKTYSFDFQLIFGAWDRLTLTLEPYKRLTTDVLYSGRISSIITDGTVMRNVGEISNTGIEFILDATLVRSRDFNWSLSVNGARNHNMVEKLYKDTHTGFFSTIWVAGQSKDAFWLVDWAGVDPVTGAPMWYDKNGDLTYSFSYDNRVFQKYSSEPILRGGVSNDFNIGRFNVRVMFDYTLGGWAYETLLNDGVNIDENLPVESLSHWTTPGEVALNPRFSYKNGDQGTFNSTRQLWKTTSIQLRSVSVGYDIPSRLTSKLGLKSSRITIIGDNLYLWTPGQNRNRNSWKTLMYPDGLRRGFSAQLSFNF